MCFILESIQVCNCVKMSLCVCFFFLSKDSHYSLSSVSEATRLQLQWLWPVWRWDHPCHYSHVCGPQACTEFSDEVPGTWPCKINSLLVIQIWMAHKMILTSWRCIKFYWGKLAYPAFSSVEHIRYSVFFFCGQVLKECCPFTKCQHCKITALAQNRKVSLNLKT